MELDHHKHVRYVVEIIIGNCYKSIGFDPVLKKWCKTKYKFYDDWPVMYVYNIYICVYIYILRCQSCPDFNVGFHVSEPQFFPRWAPYLLLCLQGVALIHELVLRTVRHEIWTGPPFPPRVTIHPSIHSSIHPSIIHPIHHPSISIHGWWLYPQTIFKKHLAAAISSPPAGSPA